MSPPQHSLFCERWSTAWAILHLSSSLSRSQRMDCPPAVPGNCQIKLLPTIDYCGRQTGVWLCPKCRHVEQKDQTWPTLLLFFTSYSYHLVHKTLLWVNIFSYVRRLSDKISLHCRTTRGNERQHVCQCLKWCCNSWRILCKDVKHLCKAAKTQGVSPQLQLVIFLQCQWFIEDLSFSCSVSSAMSFLPTSG